MRGHVLWYRPHRGAGVIAAENGAEFTFCTGQDTLGLQGGDVVEFQSRPNGERLEATDVRLVQRWVDCLNRQHRSLVNQFHSVVEVIH